MINGKRKEAVPAHLLFQAGRAWIADNQMICTGKQRTLLCGWERVFGVLHTLVERP
jgi:hypothetical protein